MALVTLTSIIAWLHVFGAIGWMGVSLFFGTVLGPLLGKLTPGTRAELIIKLFPRLLRYVTAFAGFTLLMGVALAFSVTGGDISAFSPSTQFGLFITVGAVLAVITAVLAGGVMTPTARKIVAILEAMAKNPGPPPPELATLNRRLRLAATSALILLFIVLVFMVGAAFP